MSLGLVVGHARSRLWRKADILLGFSVSSTTQKNGDAETGCETQEDPYEKVGHKCVGGHDARLGLISSCLILYSLAGRYILAGTTNIEKFLEDLCGLSGDGFDRAREEVKPHQPGSCPAAAELRPASIVDMTCR